MPTRTITLLACLAFALTACGGEQEITVEEAWGRPSPAMAAAAAFYMVIDNPDANDDTLLAGRSPSCQTVELHQSSMDTEGVMMMTPMEGGIVLPAGSSVALEPGGLHVMCIGLDHELTVGETIDLDLEFASGQTRSIAVEIREG